jgi:hypothetical protein
VQAAAPRARAATAARVMDWMRMGYPRSALNLGG